MKIDPSKWQQYSLFAAAGVIGVVQVAKFNEDGVSGYGWVFSILAMAVLITFALNKTPENLKIPASSSPAMPNKEELDEAHNVLKENAEYLFVEIEKRTNILFDQIASSNPLVPGLEIEVKGSKGLGDMFIQQTNLLLKEGCYWLMLGLVGVRRANGNSLYITGIEFRTLRDKVLPRIKEISLDIQKCSPIPLPSNPEASRNAMQSDLISVQKTIVKCCAISSENIQDKINPLVEWFNTKYGYELPPDHQLLEAASGKIYSIEK